MKESFDEDIIKVSDLLDITHNLEVRTALLRLIEVLDAWDNEVKKSDKKSTHATIKG